MKRLGFAVVMLCAVSAWAEPKPYTSAALGFTATFPFEVKEQADPAGGGTAAAFDPQGVTAAAAADLAAALVDAIAERRAWQALNSAVRL